MPNGLLNWCYKDVVEFLKTRGFVFKENRKGSHETWINFQTQAIVDVMFHGQNSIAPKTLESMIRQSGLDKKVWREWVGK
mgnify:CR=1 FL=1